MPARLVTQSGWHTSVTVRSGKPVVVRSSSEAEFRAQLIHTARMLAVIDLPGVERLVAVEDDGDRTRLITAFAGARSLAGAPPQRPEGLAAVAVGLLLVLTDLHELGFVHGQITADRIVLGRDDDPILCDFSAAARPGPDQIDLARRQELCSAGRTLLGIGERVRTGPLRHPREWSKLRRYVRISRRLAQGSSDGIDAIRRYERIGTPQHRGQPRVAAAPSAPAPRPVGRLVVASMLAVVGIVLIGSGFRGSQDRPSDDLLAATVPEATISGTMLRAADTAYEVGEPGDRVVLGDWDADGVVTPAVLRPSTGAVFVYAAWPTPDRPVVTPPVTHIRDATGLRVRSRPGDGDVLEVLRGTSPSVTVTAPEQTP